MKKTTEYIQVNKDKNIPSPANRVYLKKKVTVKGRGKTTKAYGKTKLRAAYGRGKKVEFPY
jgi:ATP:corrinoid adenosyltransferase